MKNFEPQYKLVPCEPTDEMMRAMTDPFFPVNGDTRQAFGPAYRAMLEAAPEVSAEPIVWGVYFRRLGVDTWTEYGLYPTEDIAERTAMQIRHEPQRSVLVRPLYANQPAPQPASPDVAQKLAEAARVVVNANCSEVTPDQMEALEFALAAYEEQKGGAV